MNGMEYVRILRDLREDADKTQTQIAEVLGTSQTMYARYERGANELPLRHLVTEVVGGPYHDGDRGQTVHRREHRIRGGYR